MFLSVIIAAGGVGARMERGSSKQLLDLAGKPVLARSVGIFNDLQAVREIVIAIDAADAGRCQADIVGKFNFAKVAAVIPGGASRAASVLNALAKISSAADTVLVHDGARPLFPAGLLEAGLRELDDQRLDGVVFGVPATDTVKKVDAGFMVKRTLERGRIWMAQTPQLFRRRVLEKAYRMPAGVPAQATDDATLVEIAGGRLKMVMGSYENIKLTTPVDLTVAKAILRQRNI